ncbi:CD63 antigen isoform X2 [Diabrotica virgifera virgifera]|uniref:Tetraspanin n=1 Tax=Diabrotica virgifera virgifera TaxID=50390 RepID=A0A6P7FUB7_DIAVI|nr:CD63 antigen isoform X2 [Diabrotica virgifera virgifera]
MGCATGIVKYLVFLANLLFALAGLALIIIGILIKLNVSEATNVLPKDFGLAPILSIIIGSIVFITAFLGCCGAVKESTCMLTTYAIILLTIFILQVAIGVYAFLQIKDKNSFNSVLTKSMQDTFDKIYVSQEANETMMVTQRFLKCCGVRGPEDYDIAGRKPPTSCCRNINVQCPSPNNEVNSEGCVAKLQTELEKDSKIIGGVAIGIAVVEIVGAIFALCLASSIRNSYRRHIYA